MTDYDMALSFYNDAITHLDALDDGFGDWAKYWTEEEMLNTASGLLNDAEFYLDEAEKSWYW